MRSHPLYKPLLWIILLIGCAMLFLLTMRAVTQSRWLEIDDYVEYYAAGRLNLTGGNPYNPDELLPLQQQAGRFFEVPVMMWNPPWMLTAVMPFGALDYAVGRTIWLLLSMAIVLFCSDIIWNLYHGSKKLRWLSWLLGLSFLPALDGLRTGQTGVFLFLGVVGFLYFQKNKKDWPAGAFLAFLAIKPHILYLFVIAVVFWCISKRRWAILLSGTTALVIATFLAWVVNPSVFQQYLYAVANYPPKDWATPTIGNIIRVLTRPDYFWIQFLPTVIGTIWFCFYWLRHHLDWDWLTHAPLIILVSLFTSAYGWTSDQTVALVAIISIFTRIIASRFDWKAWLVILGYLIIDGLDLALRVNQFWLWWFSPSMLIWYIISDRLILPFSPGTTETRGSV
jgi:hypothetical protein